MYERSWTHCHGLVADFILSVFLQEVTAAERVPATEPAPTVSRIMQERTSFQLGSQTESLSTAPAGGLIRCNSMRGRQVNPNAAQQRVMQRGLSRQQSKGGKFDAPTQLGLNEVSCSIAQVPHVHPSMRHSLVSLSRGQFDCGDPASHSWKQLEHCPDFPRSSR